MTEFLPLLLVAALIVAVLTSAVFVIRDLLERRRLLWQQRWHDPDGKSAVTLARQLAANRPAPGWRGWVDVSFQRMIQQSNLKLSVTQAVGIMALLAVTFGGLLVLWRDELWLAAVGAALGLLGPLLVYRYMHGRWRRQVQEQLPDALFLLGRSPISRSTAGADRPSLIWAAQRRNSSANGLGPCSPTTASDCSALRPARSDRPSRNRASGNCSCTCRRQRPCMTR